MDKYKERSRIWAGNAHGLQYNALTYNTFAISTLSYIVQLELPPEWAYKDEVDTLQAMAPGPSSQPPGLGSLLPISSLKIEIEISRVDIVAPLGLLGSASAPPGLPLCSPGLLGQKGFYLSYLGAKSF